MWAFLLDLTLITKIAPAIRALIPRIKETVVHVSLSVANPAKRTRQEKITHAYPATSLTWDFFSDLKPTTIMYKPKTIKKAATAITSVVIEGSDGNQMNHPSNGRGTTATTPSINRKIPHRTSTISKSFPSDIFQFTPIIL
jgi:hypothetical protein